MFWRIKFGEIALISQTLVTPNFRLYSILIFDPVWLLAKQSLAIMLAYASVDAFR